MALAPADQPPPEYPQAGPSNPHPSSSAWQPPSAEGANYHSSTIYQPPPTTSYANGLHARDLSIDWSNPGTASTLGRYDLEGAAAYALGPIGAAVLLVMEVENDWVRFAAWQVSTTPPPLANRRGWRGSRMGQS